MQTAEGIDFVLVLSCYFCIRCRGLLVLRQLIPSQRNLPRIMDSPLGVQSDCEGTNIPSVGRASRRLSDTRWRLKCRSDCAVRVVEARAESKMSDYSNEFKGRLKKYSSDTPSPEPLVRNEDLIDIDVGEADAVPEGVICVHVFFEERARALEGIRGKNCNYERKNKTQSQGDNEENSPNGNRTRPWLWVFDVGHSRRRGECRVIVI
jgi:hypothetical protein